MISCHLAGARENGEAAGHTEGPTDMDVDGAAHSAAAALDGDSAAAAAPGTDAAAELQVAPRWRQTPHSAHSLLSAIMLFTADLWPHDHARGQACVCSAQAMLTPNAQVLAGS